MTEVKKYALKYFFNAIPSEDGYTKQQLAEEGAGGADALMIVSILRGGKKAHDGSFSAAFKTIDGQNGGSAIPNTELFSVFSMLANHLASCGDVLPWQKELCEDVFDVIKQVVVTNKEA